ncbi:MAG: hypothetical protein ACTHKY_06890 [Ginsengibacter sp.]|jgi:hypothetical protein
MKSISIWAHQHKTSARLSIVVIYFLLNVIGICTGDILHSMEIILPFSFYLMCIVVVFAGLIIYPSKKNKSKYTNFYTKQKRADCLLIFMTFLLVIYTGNSLNNSQFENKLNPVYASSLIGKNSYGTFVSQKKETRKNFKKFIKDLRKKYKDASKTQKTIGILLAILFACGLTVVLGGLACSISCSGSEALAFIVFFIGLGGIIFGLIKLIQQIKRGPKKKQIQSTQ